VAPVVALYDACVLYPAPLRDLLMHLACTGMVHARWTDAIHEEWIRNLLANRPDLTRAQLEHTRALMERAVPDGLVRGYEPLIPTLTLPDADDRHVLAAAITAGAERIVTSNGVDFPHTALEPYGISAVHPDPFVAELFDAAPETVATAVRNQRRLLKNPPVTVAALTDTLLRLGLHQTVARLRTVTDQL
jgi:PIN domain